MALRQDGGGDWALAPITRAPAHHYNPFLSADGATIGYHRCRCLGVEACERVPPLARYTPVMPGACLGSNPPKGRGAERRRHHANLCLLCNPEHVTP